MLTRIIYGEKLEKLKIELISMGSLVEQSIVKATRAFVKKDIALADQVIKDDEKINEKEGNIENECVRLLATEQPVAGDLRLIISILNMIRDLERIGDYAAHLAQTTSELTSAETGFEADFSNITDLSVLMIKDTFRAFATQNVDLAREIRERDGLVDSFYLLLFKKILQNISEDPKRQEEGFHLLFVVKYLERLADHIVNLCEEIEYMCTGSRKDSGIH